MIYRAPHTAQGQRVSAHDKRKDLFMKLRTVRHKIEKFVNMTAKATGLSEEEIGKALTQMLELDAFVLNNDRHFNNISFIYNEKTNTFRTAPIYDNGAAFMAYKEYYRNERYTEIIESRPFSRGFANQKEIAEDLFGRQLHICLNNFSRIMPDESIYAPQVRLDIMDIIKTQARRYPDMVIIDNEENLESSFRNLKKLLYGKLMGHGQIKNKVGIKHGPKLS